MCPLARETKSKRKLASATLAAVDNLEKFWDELAESRASERPVGSMTPSEFAIRCHYTRSGAGKKLEQLWLEGKVTRTKICVDGHMITVYTPVNAA